MASKGPPTAEAPPAPPPIPLAIHPEGLPRLALPTWLHLTLYTIASILGWLGAPWLFMLFHRTDALRWLPIPIGFIAAAFAGLFTIRLIFYKLIHGRCPRCGGPAALRGGRPITYTCRECGHVHASRVSGG
jgi:hypothetical protein